MRFLAALLAAAALASSPLYASAAAVAPQPKAAESFDVGTLHVDRFGSGKQSIIVIPGLSCGPWTWYGQIAHWSPKYTVYALTLPGFDGRAPVAERPLFAAFSRDLFTLIATRHIDKPVVVGHSLGGTLAIYAAETHPELLRAVVAADGLPVFPTLATANADQRKAAAAQAAASYAALDAQKTMQYETQYMKSFGTANPATAEELATYATRSNNAAVSAWMSEDFENDLRPNLARITIPLLEVMPYDAASPMAKMYSKDQMAGFYQGLLVGAPHATVKTIEGARHFVMIDQPASFNAAVEAFFASAGA